MLCSERGKDIIELLNEEEEIYNNTILTKENVETFLGIFILKNYNGLTKSVSDKYNWNFDLQVFFIKLRNIFIDLFFLIDSINSFTDTFMHNLLYVILFAKTQKDTQDPCNNHIKSSKIYSCLLWVVQICFVNRLFSYSILY